MFGLSQHQAEYDTLDWAEGISGLIQVPKIMLEAARRAYDMAVCGPRGKCRNRQPQRHNADDVSSSDHLLHMTTQPHPELALYKI